MTACRSSRATLIIACVAIGALFASSVANARPAICGERLSVGETVVTSVIGCTSTNLSPRVFAGGRELVIARLSQHRTMDTFYGSGVVVRLHQIGRLVYVRAVSVSGRRMVTIELPATG